LFPTIIAFGRKNTDILPILSATEVTESTEKYQIIADTYTYGTSGKSFADYAEERRQNNRKSSIENRKL